MTRAPYITRPRAAPAYFPYFHHRTVGEMTLHLIDGARSRCNVVPLNECMATDNPAHVTCGRCLSLGLADAAGIAA